MLLEPLSAGELSAMVPWAEPRTHSAHHPATPEEHNGPKCHLAATTLAKPEAWLKTRDCEPSWARADQVRASEGLTMSPMPRSSLLSSHPVFWTNTDEIGHESFDGMPESTRPPGADLVSKLGPGLRTLYGDQLTEALPWTTIPVLGNRGDLAHATSLLAPGSI